MWGYSVPDHQETLQGTALSCYDQLELQPDQNLTISLDIHGYTERQIVFCNNI